MLQEAATTPLTHDAWTADPAVAAPHLRFEDIALPGRRLSFTLHAGEILHLQGGTTMAQLRVLGIASAFGFGRGGRCLIFGLDLMALSPEQRVQLRQQQIGRVLQTDTLPDGLPLLAAAAQPALQRGCSAHEALHRAAQVLDALGLAEAQSLPPAALSPAATRLGLVARALVARPRLLLLERPELGLGEAEVTSLLLALQDAAAGGAGVLLTSTHRQLAAAAHRSVQLDA